MEADRLLAITINHANEELQSFNELQKFEDNYTFVMASIFRKIIELSEGALVCAKAGLRGPTDINYRGLIEAYLALKYITQDKKWSKSRAMAYRINYHKHQIEASKFLTNRLVDVQSKARHEQMIKNNYSIINKPEYKNVLNEYNRLHQKDPRKHLPKWYSLYRGPNSINQLAERFKQDKNDPDRGIVATLYSFLSIGAHNFLTLRDIDVDDSGSFSIKESRYSLDSNNPIFNLDVVRSILASSMLNFTRNVYKEFLSTDQYKEFLSLLSEHINRN